MNKLYTVRLSLAFAILCCPAIVLGQNTAVNYLPYDCQENRCEGVDCDFATGKCLGCDQTTHDYACRPINLATCTGCAVNDPILETVGSDFCTSASQCACAEGRHGADCTTKTLDITCNADNIDITVNPYPKLDGTPFGGKIFFSTTRNINFDNLPANCQSSGDASLQRVLKQAGSGATATCDEVLAPTADTGGGLVMYIYIQQRLDVRSPSDYYLRVACMEAATGDTGTYEIQSALDTVEPLPSTVDTAASGVTMTVQKQTGANTWEAIGANLVVGEPISIILSHGTKFYPRECRVTNLDPAGPPNLGNFRQLWLFKEWCVPEESESFFRAKPIFLGTGDNGGQTANEFGWRMDLKAFYFAEGGSNLLFFMCFICDDTTLANCVPSATPICPNDFYDYDDLNGQIGSASRRRRDVPVEAGLGTTNTSLAVYVKVESNIVQDADRNGSSESANVEECYKSTSVLLPIILLAALLLVTMVMTFFFCMKVTHSQEQQQSMGHENMSYKS